jgi:hypothetical protein
MVLLNVGFEALEQSGHAISLWFLSVAGKRLGSLNEC